MIVVIQCASSKREDAGMLRTPEGKPVQFVAHPDLAPPTNSLQYARPDDDSGNGETWRDKLVRYNNAPGDDPLRLVPAYELYARDTYRRLVDRFGICNTYILSAGWGLINASFLTPTYDITFSAAADPYKRRRKYERYRDLQMLHPECEDEIVFLGGKDYLPLFCSLTSGLHCRKTIYYNSGSPPVAPGYSFKRFATATRTNWHYECADQLLTS